MIYTVVLLLVLSIVLVVVGFKKERLKVDPTEKTSFDLVKYASNDELKQRALYFLLFAWMLKKNTKDKVQKRAFAVRYLAEKFKEEETDIGKEFDLIFSKSVHARSLARWTVDLFKPPKQRLEIMKLLICLANAANELSDREFVALVRFGQWIGVGEGRINHIMVQLANEKLDLHSIDLNQISNPLLKKHKAYELLQLEYGSSQKSIKLAYKKLAKQLHPDLHAGLSEKDQLIMKEKFIQLKQAFDFLIKMD